MSIRVYRNGVQIPLGLTGTGGTFGMFSLDIYGNIVTFTIKETILEHSGDYTFRLINEYREAILTRILTVI